MKRALGPVRDDTIAALSDEDRRFVADSCLRRSELELRGGAAFTMVTQALFDLGAETNIVDMSARAIVEEMNHSRIYLDAAAVYAGVPVAAPAAAPIRIPRYPNTGPALEAALRVVGMCAINETMACAFLELCRLGATGPLLRSALHTIIEDEIHHAQIGWAFLSSPRLVARDRTLLSSWLVTLLDNQLRGWRNQIVALPARTLPAHGCPDPADIDASALSAIRDLVIPGFARVGLDVSAATVWFEQVTPRASARSTAKDRSAVLSTDRRRW